MRAVLCTEFGEPESLVVEEIADPKPGAGELRIAVVAAGVNFADLLMVAGTYQEKPPFPFSPGLEVAGTVIDWGPGVTGFEAGDRVMAVTGTGGFSEQVVVKPVDVFKLPTAMSFEAAAGFPVAYGTAYGALNWRAHMAGGAWPFPGWVGRVGVLNYHGHCAHRRCRSRLGHRPHLDTVSGK